MLVKMRAFEGYRISKPSKDLSREIVVKQCQRNENNDTKNELKD